eukprot:1240566-Amphidinium_carterae.3
MKLKGVPSFVIPAAANGGEEERLYLFAGAPGPRKVKVKAFFGQVLQSQHLEVKSSLYPTQGLDMQTEYFEKESSAALLDHMRKDTEGQLPDWTTFLCETLLKTSGQDDDDESEAEPERGLIAPVLIGPGAAEHQPEFATPKPKGVKSQQAKMGRQASQSSIGGGLEGGASEVGQTEDGCSTILGTLDMEEDEEDDGDGGA